MTLAKNYFGIGSLYRYLCPWADEIVLMKDGKSALSGRAGSSVQRNRKAERDESGRTGSFTVI